MIGLVRLDQREVSGEVLQERSKLPGAGGGGVAYPKGYTAITRMIMHSDE